MYAFADRFSAASQPPQPTTSHTTSSHPSMLAACQPSTATARYEEISRLSATELSSVAGVFELLQQGRYRRAAHHLAKLQRSVKPDDLSFQSVLLYCYRVLKELRARYYVIKGDRYAAQGDFVKAVKTYAKVNLDWVEHIEDSLLIQMYVNRAYCCMHLDRYAEAIQDLQRARSLSALSPPPPQHTANTRANPSQRSSPHPGSSQAAFPFSPHPVPATSTPAVLPSSVYLMFAYVLGGKYREARELAKEVQQVHRAESGLPGIGVEALGAGLRGADSGAVEELDWVCGYVQVLSLIHTDRLLEAEAAYSTLVKGLAGAHQMLGNGGSDLIGKHADKLARYAADLLASKRARFASLASSLLESPASPAPPRLLGPSHSPAVPPAHSPLPRLLALRSLGRTLKRRMKHMLLFGRTEEDTVNSGAKDHSKDEKKEEKEAGGNAVSESLLHASNSSHARTPFVLDASVSGMVYSTSLLGDSSVHSLPPGPVPAAVPRESSMLLLTRPLPPIPTPTPAVIAPTPTTAAVISKPMLMSMSTSMPAQHPALNSLPENLTGSARDGVGMGIDMVRSMEVENCGLVFGVHKNDSANGVGVAAGLAPPRPPKPLLEDKGAGSGRGHVRKASGSSLVMGSRPSMASPPCGMGVGASSKAQRHSPRHVLPLPAPSTEPALNGLNKRHSLGRSSGIVGMGVETMGEAGVVGQQVGVDSTTVCDSSIRNNGFSVSNADMGANVDRSDKGMENGDNLLVSGKVAIHPNSPGSLQDGTVENQSVRSDFRVDMLSHSDVADGAHRPYAASPDDAHTPAEYPSSSLSSATVPTALAVVTAVAAVGDTPLQVDTNPYTHSSTDQRSQPLFSPQLVEESISSVQISTLTDIPAALTAILPLKPFNLPTQPSCQPVVWRDLPSSTVTRTSSHGQEVFSVAPESLYVSGGVVVSLPAAPLKIFPYAQLRAPGPYPVGVDVAQREAHLSDEEFASLFKMTREQFVRLPAWKRVGLKKEKGLF